MSARGACALGWLKRLYELKKLSVLISPLLKELDIEDGVRFESIKKDWQQLFNMPISLHMSPARLKEGELLINVDSPVWLQQLSFYKADIIKKLSPFGVGTVRFRLGRVSAKTESGVRSQKSKVRRLTTEELSYIEDTVSPISDQELRDKISKAIEKSIALRTEK